MIKVLSIIIQISREKGYKKVFSFINFWIDYDRQDRMIMEKEKLTEKEKMLAEKFRKEEL
ncbi:MAG: hypothetical protein EGR73_09785 [Lachnospiraceae bacterium]|nr:hypothetical protein [Lachnospiraceae bacterium]